MKLLRFLERRLPDMPRSALHKWIRTGQIRVNGSRAKAFRLLLENDLVRVPPFAASDTTEPDRITLDRPYDMVSLQSALGADLPVVSLDSGLLVLAKPAGLACQGGSATSDSLAARLRQIFTGASYTPAPAHRLDKHTSGLVLAGMTHKSQRRLHELFKYSGVCKEYLAWAVGAWPPAGPLLLTDRLEAKTAASGHEYIAALPGGETRSLDSVILRKNAEPAELNRSGDPPVPEKSAKNSRLSAGTSWASWAGRSAIAQCVVLLVQSMPWPGSRLPSAPHHVSLLLIRLLTGQKRQIRAQLASRGHAIVGDCRYNGPSFPLMLLHAYSLTLPADLSAPLAALREFSLPPAWPEPWMPDEPALTLARSRLRRQEAPSEQSNDGINQQ